jgi:hypothetical protein
MTMANVNVGRAHTGMEKPTHVKGVIQGNAPGNYEKMRGHNPDGTSTAARSTGVNVKAEEPIDASMPNLSPA